MKKVNMNNLCRVKLTEAGKSALEDHKATVKQSIGNKLAVLFADTIEEQYTPESDGTFRCQIWKLFEIFGDHIGQGIDVPFVNNEIIYD